MTLILRSLVTLFAILCILIGLTGMFQPAQLAAMLGFEPPAPEALGNIRALIGAHYIAMGAVCLLALIRSAPALLLPIGLIEAMMVLARLISALNGEFSQAIIVPTLIEFLASLMLILAARHLSEKSPDT